MQIGWSFETVGCESNEIIMTDRIETREVLAAAYLGPNKRRMLSHAVKVDFYGGEFVLCGSVMTSSLADANAGDPTAPPTCPKCQSRLRTLIKRNARMEIRAAAPTKEQTK